jgi:hypothetical protein
MSETNELYKARDIEILLNLTEASLTDDMLDVAQKQVEEILDKDYGSAKSETEEFYLYEKTNVIKLKHRNIVEVSSFTIEDVNEDGLSEDDDEYYLLKNEGIIKCSLLTTFKTITITYTYGNCSIGTLDKYLQVLFVLKQIIMTNPDLINKEEISEKIGDYSVTYNVTELKSRPELIDKEINKVISISDGNDLFFF